MKNILFFTNQYDGVFGSTRSMIQLVKTLNESPQNRCVVLTTGKGRFGDLLDGENLSWDTIPTGRFSGLTSGKLANQGIKGKIRAAIELVIFQLKVFLYIQHNKIDIVYANNPGSFFRIQWAARLNRTKTITYVRSAVTDDLVTRSTLKRSHMVITIADGLLDALPGRFVEKYRDKIRTIYTGFDFDSFNFTEKIPELSGKKVKIAYVASLTSRKGIDFLINLLIDNHDISKRVQLIIAGDYSKGHEGFKRVVEPLLQKMDDMNIDYINLGFQKNIHVLYNSIDILALPSLSEGLPRVVVESMAHRCAVIANDVGGTGQIISHGINGFLEKPNDSKNWGFDLKQLVLNPQLRTQFGMEAEKTVREKFSLNTFRTKVETAFSSF